MTNDLLHGILPAVGTPFDSEEEFSPVTFERLLERIAKPEEIAEVTAFLAHDRAPFVTGAVWTADGGLRTRIGGAQRIEKNR